MAARAEAEEADQRDEKKLSEGSVGIQRRKGIQRGLTTAAFELDSTQKVTLANTLNLTAYQQQLLLQNWPRIYGTGGTKMGNAVINELCARSPVVKELFNKSLICGAFTPRSVDMRQEHGRWLADLLDSTLKSLKLPAADVMDQCQEYGMKHFSLKVEGLDKRVWDTLGDVLLEFVRRNEAVRKHRDLARAWAVVITFLIDRFKEGQQSSGEALRPPRSPTRNLPRVALPSDDHQLSVNMFNYKRSLPGVSESPEFVRRSWSQSSAPVLSRQPRQDSPLTTSRGNSDAAAFLPRSPSNSPQVSPRGSSAGLSTRPSLAEHLNLGSYQQQQLMQGWPKMCFARGAGQIGQEIFFDLCAANPVARELFQKASIVEGFSQMKSVDGRKEHGRWLLELIDLSVKSLGAPVEEISDKLLEIGIKHRHLKMEGLDSDLWDLFSDTTLEHIRKFEAVRKHREVSRAWAQLISFIVDKLKEGQGRFSLGEIPQFKA